jgi:hypothetical protein
MTCPTCGAWPCINPSFCTTCRDADQRKARGEQPRHIEPNRWNRMPDHIPCGWESMSLDALLAHFDRGRCRHGAPRSTVEALAYQLRGGVDALRERSTLRRISELNEPQMRNMAERLTKERWNKQGSKKVPPPWQPDEIETLIKIWMIAHEQD